MTFCANCGNPLSEHRAVASACPGVRTFISSEHAAASVLLACIADVPNDAEKWFVERLDEGWRCTTLNAWLMAPAGSRGPSIEPIALLGELASKWRARMPDEYLERVDHALAELAR